MPNSIRLQPSLPTRKAQASITTGLGDLLVIAYRENLTAWQKVTPGNVEKVVLVLTEPDLTEREIDLDIIPPVARSVERTDQALTAENNRRLRLEDIIRAAYESSFINKDIAAVFAREKGLPEDLTWKYLEASRGNWPEILDYLYSLKPEEFSLGLGLLGSVTAKDLRDSPAEILLHHLREAPVRSDGLDEETFINYVVSPRIGRELLTSWRKSLKEKFKESETAAFRENPDKIAGWIKANIKIDESNYYHVPLFPHRVLQLGQADIYSMKVLLWLWPGLWESRPG